MKKRIISILSVIFQAIDTLLCKMHLRRPKVVIFMDGGICSQMLVYIQGMYYAEQGLDVCYDLTWYAKGGKDQNGIMPRYFEFDEMWPRLECKTISSIQRKWYLLFFKAKRVNADWLPEPSSIRHSIYLDGFWDMPRDAYKRLYAEVFDLKEAAMPNICKGLDFKDTIGIHVRRGDLAKGDNPTYGGVTEGYFMCAIELCNEEFKPKKYMFFSDEPDWVEENICPQLNKPYEIIRGNKGWEDLWLLAHCPVIVASQGSFGKVAAQLNPEAALVQCDNKYAKRDRDKTYFVK